MRTVSLIATAVLAAGNQIIENRYISREEAVFEQVWTNFKAKYAKKYENVDEEAARKIVFAKNLDLIDQRNAADPLAVHAVTKFCDLTPEEFTKYFLTYKPNSDKKVQALVTTRKTAVASNCTDTECDWAAVGAVGAVRDQGQCGSCWAFSTVEQVTSDVFLAGGKLTVLSPQQLVDCERDGGDDGCNGGDPVNAYPYIVTAGGLESEVSYPYKTKNHKCAFNASKAVAAITGFEHVVPPCLGAKNTCEAQVLGLANATAYVKNSGPTSICVNAGPWQTYSSGILSTGCGYGFDDLDHCVQLTGYGIEKGVAYWKVRNSWGVDWGLQGYIHVATKDNTCGILDEMTVSLGAHAI